VAIESLFDSYVQIIPITHQRGAKTTDEDPIVDIIVSPKTRLDSAEDNTHERRHQVHNGTDDIAKTFILIDQTPLPTDLTDTSNRIVKVNIANVIKQYITMLHIAQPFTTRMVIKTAETAEYPRRSII
jgi:ACT domain-containing protein